MQVQDASPAHAAALGQQYKYRLTVPPALPRTGLTMHHDGGASGSGSVWKRSGKLQFRPKAFKITSPFR